jgi:7,8-dihydro-6-hydroxymethylpterin dimethyltransferase
VPISTFVSAVLGQDKVTFTAHPHCGMASYLFVKDENTIIPLTKFIKVESLFAELFELSKKTDGATFKLPAKAKALGILKRNMIKENIPDGMSTTQFLKMMSNVFNNETKEGLAKFSWNMLLVSGMHFQDSYNYDVERVKRCVIHYATPDGRIIPFCAYNSGPVYRTEVEKKFSVPLEEWRKTKGTEYT